MLHIPANNRRARFISCLIIITLSGFVYSGVQHLALWFHEDIPQVPLSAIDAAIPFWSYALLPYASLGVFLLFIGVVAEPIVFRRFVRAALIAQGIAYTIFLLFPMTVPRPEPSESMVDQLVLWLINSADLPLNTVPSLHVAYACIGAFCRPRWWILIWAVLISLSVLPLKQHYVLDVITGLATGIVAWHLSRLTKSASAQ